jgi:uncharacterized protein Yka (UPF0111/DUF47 family)
MEYNIASLDKIVEKLEEISDRLGSIAMALESIDENGVRIDTSEKEGK